MSSFTQEASNAPQQSSPTTVRGACHRGILFTHTNTPTHTLTHTQTQDFLPSCFPLGLCVTAGALEEFPSNGKHDSGADWWGGFTPVTSDIYQGTLLGAACRLALATNKHTIKQARRDKRALENTLQCSVLQGCALLWFAVIVRKNLVELGASVPRCFKWNGSSVCKSYSWENKKHFPRPAFPGVPFHITFNEKKNRKQK